MGAIFAVALARVNGVSELPGERIALAARAGRPLWEVAGQIARSVAAHDVARTEAVHDVACSGDRARTRAGAPARPHVGARSSVLQRQQSSPGVTLLIGSERDGLPDELVAECEHVAHVPIASDSLNAAMAATVALYELARRSTRVPA
jgi:tRNA C32,U32 (ribose-2'-O)-methylase TrmJ